MVIPLNKRTKPGLQTLWFLFLDFNYHIHINFPQLIFYVEIIMSEEKFVKENAYTLSVVSEDRVVIHNNATGYDSGSSASSLTKTFNFLSAQVTTIARDSLFEWRNSQAGGSAATSTQMIIQNFSDIESKEEIKLMREKLVEMGGTPPELSFELPGKGRQPRLGG
jgi:hypothetical protein